MAYVLRDLPDAGESAARWAVDLHLPEGDGPFPLLVWIHGGGWHSGTKDIDFAEPYLRSGFALASIGYRLTSGGSCFPAPIEDCVAAVAWLQQNAARWNIDCARLGVFGHSAGGHLASLVALASVGATPFTRSDLQPFSRVLVWSGPLNLAREVGGWPRSTFAWNPDDAYCRTFFPGGAYDEEFAAWASPASYLSPAMPPVLVIHGQDDSLVPWEQARDFAGNLRALGVDASFELIPGAGHDIIGEERHRQAREFFSPLKPKAAPAA